MKKVLTPSHLVNKFQRDADFEYPRELEWLEMTKRNFRNKVAGRKTYAIWLYNHKAKEAEKVKAFRVQVLRDAVSDAIPYALKKKLYRYKSITEVWEKTFIIFGLKIDIRKANPDFITEE